MTRLTFEKLSQFDRAAEPVTVSIPFTQGALADPEYFTMTDAKTPLPTQRRTLAHWPNGSVKWLLVHMQPDLPGNRAKTLHFHVDKEGNQPQPVQQCTVTEAANGIMIDTGLLSFRIANASFTPLSDVKLAGQALWENQVFAGFDLRFGDQVLTTLDTPTTVEVIEAVKTRLQTSGAGLRYAKRGGVRCTGLGLRVS